MERINNVEDLRLDVIKIYEELRTGKLGLREAKELNNAAGKILGSAKLELEYNAYTKTQKRILFLETPKVK